jgi:SulP family sulfate permease
VVIFNVIARHGYDGLLLATLLAGLMLIVAGYARLGQVIKFIPHPVITGFTAGIAVIIASSQVKDFLGLQTGKVSADFLLQWLRTGRRSTRSTGHR